MQHFKIQILTIILETEMYHFKQINFKRSNHPLSWQAIIGNKIGSFRLNSNSNFNYNHKFLIFSLVSINRFMTPHHVLPLTQKQAMTKHCKLKKGQNSIPRFMNKKLQLLKPVSPVVNVIKLFLEEIQKIEISPEAETERIVNFKRNQLYQIKVLH